jgi:hypothetical protein
VNVERSEFEENVKTIDFWKSVKLGLKPKPTISAEILSFCLALILLFEQILF